MAPKKATVVIMGLTFKESPSSKKIAKFKEIEAGTMEVKLHADK